jgi:hypothetical protein
MNKLIVLLLVSTTGLAYLDRHELHVQTKIPLEEINKALDYLNETEAGCDADWGVYYTIVPRLINQFGFNTAVEIGISFGSHCKKILETTNIKKLYGIDPYLNYGDFTNLVTSDNYYEIFFHKVKNKLSVFGDRFELIRDFSLNAARRFKDGEIDIAFLDANHNYAEVLKDLEAWWPKIKEGGIMAGDDYATRHPGVPRAVNEFFGKKGISIMLDKDQPRVWIVFKPKGSSN